jgi:phage-related tail protein
VIISSSNRDGYQLYKHYKYITLKKKKIFRNILMTIKVIKSHNLLEEVETVLKFHGGIVKSLRRMMEKLTI